LGLFFPVPNADPELWALYDWSHGENQFLSGGFVWATRALGFLANGLPLPGMTGEEETFWSRFRFKEECWLGVAESHGKIADLIGRGDTVVNYDAHHDAGYGKKLQDFQVSCEDWAHYAVECRKAKVKVVYPSWKRTARCFPEKQPDCKRVKREVDDGAADLEPFDAVFVCRSGAWVPAWLDDQFEAFVKQAGLRIVPLQDILHRGWNDRNMQETLQEQVAALKLVHEMNKVS
jgi:hypothetical protein